MHRKLMIFSASSHWEANFPSRRKYVDEKDLESFRLHFGS
jgi:hypothetical protein